jgi:hypothetical protein
MEKRMKYAEWEREYVKLSGGNKPPRQDVWNAALRHGDRDNPSDIDVNDAIKDRGLIQIQHAIKYSMCYHVWEKHGFGYRCKKCDYYTGMSDLTQIIKQVEEKKCLGEKDPA